MTVPHTEQGGMTVAEKIRSRETMTPEDGLVLTLLDLIAERDRLLAAIATHREKWSGAVIHWSSNEALWDAAGLPLPDRPKS